LLIHP
jgi:cyanate lyase